MTETAAATHTPGPWKLIEEGEGWWGVRTTDGQLGIGIFQSEANARLIAAAPALLAAAQDAAAHFEGTNAPLGVRLRAAIEAAT